MDWMLILTTGAGLGATAFLTTVIIPRIQCELAFYEARLTERERDVRSYQEIHNQLLEKYHSLREENFSLRRLLQRLQSNEQHVVNTLHGLLEFLEGDGDNEEAE